MAKNRHYLFRERARVRQLKRTELARRVESAQCLRSPHSLTKLAGAPIDSYSLRAPHNATSVIGDPAEFRGVVGYAEVVCAERRLY